MKITTLPSWAITAAGGVAGLAAAGVGMMALPIALPVGIAVGGAVDYYRHVHGHKVTVGVSGPAGSGGSGPAAPPVPVMRMIIRASPAAAAAPMKAATASAAAAEAPIPEATTLYNYLAKYPDDRMVMGAMFFQNQPVPGLTQEFQAAFNKDPASKVLGQLKVDGVYDAGTAAALAFFTHNPIAAP